MSVIGYEDFAPYHSGSEWLCEGEADQSDLLPITPSGLAILSNSKGEQQKTIRLCYNPANFQHWSLIARKFSPDFLDHGDQGDSCGLATVINALPHITFALPDSHVRLQFILAEAETPVDDESIDLSPLINAATGSVRVTWTDTLMWRLDTDGTIIERWQTPLPATVRQPCRVTLRQSR